MNCCENALLVYNATYEEILEEQRKILYKPLVGDCMSWSRLGAIPSANVRRANYLPSKNLQAGDPSMSNRHISGPDDIEKKSFPSSSRENGAVTSFNRKLQNEGVKLSRITRKMMVSALGVLNISEELQPAQKDFQNGSRSHLTHSLNALIPSVVLNESLLKQLQALNQS